ncbi:MAG TPA: TraM recognition domain-containing protein [Candidatus Angelobacter sp.]|nr:TraM recognition domain-containing protein [Candidatus Angelobacter sp.]
MQDDRNHNNSRESSHDANAPIWLTLLAFALVGVGIYLLINRLHVRKEQLIEIAIYLVCLAGAIYSVVMYWQRHKERARKTRPRSTLTIRHDRRQRNIKKAHERDSVVAGYDVTTGKPVLWPDDVRTMGANLVGRSGSGKSTFMRNLIMQDAMRVVQINGGLRHLPIMLVDGKGDQEFANTIMEDMASIGRLQDVRLLDPSRSDLSVRYNALEKGRNESCEEHVNFIMESLGLAQDFFKGHQATYFTDLVRVLDHSKSVYNIYDVLVMAFDPRNINEQIDKAIYYAENSSGVTQQQRLSLSMSIHNLRESLQDNDRVQKIQGLLDPLMAFLEEDLAVLTGSYDQLLTLTDVFDQDLILIVTLNANSNERAVPALGRILLKNVQLLVGKRYSRENRMLGMPMASIILDEFASFAFPTFPRILETARGANVSVVFSLQSIAQLASVSPAFRDHIAATPNTIMLMQSWDPASAECFQRAAPNVLVESLTETVEDRGWFGKKYAASGKALSRPVEEPLVGEKQIGSLPRGQMHMLMADPRGEPRYSHLIVPTPNRALSPCFVPTVYPPIPGSNWLVPNGANLRFKDSGPVRRTGRLGGRRS